MSTESTEITSLTKYWHLIQAVIQEMLAITEPHIEEAAVRNNIPIELYYYGEFGLNNFSVAEFQQRDPFSNPEQFERLFPRLELKGWIIPMKGEGRFSVTEKARQAVRQIIQAGDDQLTKFQPGTALNLEGLLSFLKQVRLANNAAPEPPEKWAILKRFRVSTPKSPTIVQVRDHLMDILAYHDDAHLAAARPHFNQAGIAWIALGAVATGSAVTAEKMAETLSFRGYEIDDYEVAIKAALAVGWLEAADLPSTFRPTAKGWQLREQAEKLTDEYFYRPWAMFSQPDLDKFSALLTKLREQLHGYKKIQ